jgi:hypothetical protein
MSSSCTVHAELDFALRLYTVTFSNLLRNFKRPTSRLKGRVTEQLDIVEFQHEFEPRFIAGNPSMFSSHDSTTAGGNPRRAESGET